MCGFFYLLKERRFNMALSNRVISITEEKYVPTSIDAVLNSNVFTSRTFMRDVKNWSGRQLQIPLQFAKPTSGGSFSGVGTFDTSLQDTRVRQTFTTAQFYQNVSVSGGEVSLNHTDAEVLDLVKVTLEEAQNSMLDSIGTQLYGSGAGDDFLGLGAIVDDGTNTSTYGGLTRTTYPALNSTLSAASGGALTFGLMATIMRGTSAAGTKRQRPSIIVTTETVWDLLESLFTPTIQSTYSELSRAYLTTYAKPGVTFQNQESLKGQYGFETLCWRGIPVVADEKCDSGAMFFLNEEYLNWYNLKGEGLTNYKANGQVDGVYKEYEATYPIQWSGFDKPFNQYAQIGQFIMLGNLISGQTRRHGKATAITTV
jgi:hypothetical protein